MTASLALLTLIASLQASVVTTHTLSEPEKALKFEVVVPASLDEVWTAFSTREGMETWLWREARVDFREGGEWTVVYTPTATGGGTIVSITPKREIVIRALAPEKFPVVRETRTTVTFSFEALGRTSTKVTLLQTGWKTGPEWDAAYDYLSRGNAQLFTQLHRRFTSGPIDWAALMRPPQ